MDKFVPCLTPRWDGPELIEITLGDPLLDDYSAFAAARSTQSEWPQCCLFKIK